MSLKEWQSVFKDATEEIEEDYGDSWKIEFDDSIEPDNPAHNWSQYRRESFARFKCSKCKTNTWGSKKVHVVFHFYLNKNNGKGKVKVRHSEQNCKKCQNARMEKPHFDKKIIKNLLEKVVEKICIRYYNKEPPAGTNQGPEVHVRSKPHESAHCSFCQMGYCQEAERVHAACAFKEWLK